MVLDVPLGILVDVGVVQKYLVVLDARKGIADLALAGPQRFYLGAAQDDSGFKSFQDVIIPARFGVGDNIGHRNPRRQAAPERPLTPGTHPASAGKDRPRPARGANECQPLSAFSSFCRPAGPIRPVRASQTRFFPR